MKRLETRADVGAPAALKAVEEHELQCRQEKDRLRRERDTAQALVVEGDDVSERKARRCSNDYIDALQNWDEALKRLSTFDKGVKPERREGENIPIEEAREMFKQLLLSINLAVESYILSQSQGAALCRSEQEFHIAHAENIRAAMDGALSAAKRDGVIASWME